MKKINKLGISLVLSAASGLSFAEQYNHGNHNDPQKSWHEDQVETFSCGASSLATCISGVNLTNITQQFCRDMVRDNTDTGYFLSTQSYYHSVQSYALHIMSAIDLNNGSGANAYSIDVRFSCSGLLHPGITIVNDIISRD